jgi:2-iminobutanoate/2-iminopropanoate deaminase
MSKVIAILVVPGLFAPLLLGCSRDRARPEAGPRSEIQRIPGSAGSPILAGVVVAPASTLVYLSGQVPAAVDATRPADSLEAYGDTKTQAVSAFTKIKGLLADQHLSLGDVVKLTVYLVGDPNKGGKLDFKGFSEAYAQFFGTPDQPNRVARTTVQVAALANPGFLVEIEATAAKVARE